MPLPRQNEGLADQVLIFFKLQSSGMCWAKARLWVFMVGENILSDYRDCKGQLIR